MRCLFAPFVCHHASSPYPCCPAALVCHVPSVQCPQRPCALPPHPARLSHLGFSLKPSPKPAHPNAECAGASPAHIQPCTVASRGPSDLSSSPVLVSALARVELSPRSSW
eukprot:352421-Chlamydomonas_euryale.AAC.92